MEPRDYPTEQLHRLGPKCRPREGKVKEGRKKNGAVEAGDFEQSSRRFQGFKSAAKREEHPNGRSRLENWEMWDDEMEKIPIGKRENLTFLEHRKQAMMRYFIGVRASKKKEGSQSGETGTHFNHKKKGAN